VQTKAKHRVNTILHARQARSHGDSSDSVGGVSRRTMGAAGGSPNEDHTIMWAGECEQQFDQASGAITWDMMYNKRVCLHM